MLRIANEVLEKPMKNAELKALADQFRQVADDYHAVLKLAEETAEKDLNNITLNEFCRRLAYTDTRADVLGICNEMQTQGTLT